MSSVQRGRRFSQVSQLPSLGPSWPLPAETSSSPGLPPPPAQGDHAWWWAVQADARPCLWGRRTLPLCRRAGWRGRGRGWLGAAGSSACPLQSRSGAAACGPSAPPHSFWPCLRQGTQHSWGAPAAGGGQGSDWCPPLPLEFLSAQIP